MQCPKCKAKIGIMKHQLVVETGAIHCIKCYICGFWVQIGYCKGNDRGPEGLSPGGTLWTAEQLP